MPATSITLRTLKAASLPRHGPLVFALVRDEDYFLPHFFAHYRALGVAGFLIYDDRSQAPTRDFLAAQPDCLVVTSDHSFGDFFD
ncbi:MAG TPA: glycosyltransferase family 2 protein, partial [Caulobacteraceae bacterium]|nr:glycosyltransferase family 2 protein [Caulobacteraceae bacterium]